MISALSHEYNRVEAHKEKVICYVRWYIIYLLTACGKVLVRVLFLNGRY